jgi:hypothetical protein
LNLVNTHSPIRHTIAPPEEHLFHFGGEIYTRFNNGDVHYQDEFGRTDKPHDFPIKKSAEAPLRSSDLCGCGSGLVFKDCCQSRPVHLRPTWTERSIRERNLMLFNGIANVLKFDGRRDWLAIRRELTDEQIRDVYLIYQALWPVDTDLLQLLPKPDGRSRAVYTGHTLEGGEKGGQLNMMKLAPNFEMAMYIAQATGSCIVTDSRFRWDEIKRAVGQSSGPLKLTQLKGSVERAPFLFFQSAEELSRYATPERLEGYSSLWRAAFEYLLRSADRTPKPNFEQSLNGRFVKLHSKSQSAVKEFGAATKEGRVRCAFPPDGIQDNSINRLLLMSSSEYHLSSVPMAFYIEDV